MSQPRDVEVVLVEGDDRPVNEVEDVGEVTDVDEPSEVGNGKIIWASIVLREIARRRLILD